MCCGNKRSILRNASATLTTASVPRGPRPNPVAGPASKLAAEPSPAVTLHYLDRDPIRVWGPVTGRSYEFSSARPSQPVDPRDAAVLSRSRFFRRG